VIIESGKHDKLVRSGSLYADLYKLQARREEDEPVIIPG
jgi:ABC-type multidrug transport system fused ATPase/permease subunit